MSNKRVDDWIDRIGAYTTYDSSRKQFLSRCDFGSEYLEKCGIESRHSTIDECKNKFVWGTYGKNREYYPNPKYVKLCECSDDHLMAILETQKYLSNLMMEVIKGILDDR